jgi:putative component of membrane protein insertase Oxa1/YidC/SpoIIIJ protein YidD
MKRGFFVGLILTVGRIFRCNPFFKGGYDPVPGKGFRNPKTNGTVGDKTETEKDFSNDEN